jgi:hypothetical protein
MIINRTITATATQSIILLLPLLVAVGGGDAGWLGGVEGGGVGAAGSGPGAGV